MIPANKQLRIMHIMSLKSAASGSIRSAYDGGFLIDHEGATP